MLPFGYTGISSRQLAIDNCSSKRFASGTIPLLRLPFHNSPWERLSACLLLNASHRYVEVDDAEGL